MPTLNDVLAGSQAQAVQVQQIIDALKGVPGKGVPVALVSLNDPSNYALTVQNDDPVNSRALSVLKADGTTLISADATGVTLGSPVHLPPGSLSGTGLASASVPNAALGPDVARANLLINGGFEIWQRGTSFAAANAYWADGWLGGYGGTAPTVTITKETSTIDAGSQTAAKIVHTPGTGQTFFRQMLKMSDGYQLRGTTVSGSVRVNAGVNGSVFMRMTSDGTGAVSPASSPNSAVNTWQTLSVTLPVPADATFVVFDIVPNTTLTFYVDNACLVMGAQPANYTPLQPADELARCLRYFEQPNFANSTFFGTGLCVSTTVAHVIWFYKVIKAITPTITVSRAAGATVETATGTGAISTGWTTDSIWPTACRSIITTAGLAAGNGTAGFFSASNDYIQAEANP